MYRDAVSTLAVYGPPLRRRFSLSPKFMDQRYTVLQTECGTVVPVKGLEVDVYITSTTGPILCYV